MAQCMHSNCTEPALHKCTGRWCHGGVYCVQHIQFLDGEYICDLCRDREQQAFIAQVIPESERHKAEQREASLRLSERFRPRHTPKASTIRLLRILLSVSLILMSIGGCGSFANPAFSYLNPFTWLLLVGGVIWTVVLIRTVIIAGRRGQAKIVKGFISPFGFLSFIAYLIQNPELPDE